MTEAMIKVFEEIANEQGITVEEARRKYGGVSRGLGGNKLCSFETIDGNATVDVYPAAAVIDAKSGRSYNQITLTESDINDIRNCMIKGMKEKKKR